MPQKLKKRMPQKLKKGAQPNTSTPKDYSAKIEADYEARVQNKNDMNRYAPESGLGWAKRIRDTDMEKNRRNLARSSKPGMRGRIESESTYQALIRKKTEESDQ